jgi:FKBP-type peptidyl-prolyl cis-trans isomerase FkpA
MIAGQTIPGFAEALGKMQKGGSYRVFIPSRLAYGAEPPPNSVPPNSDLEFDVRIVEVVPNAALMAGQQQQQQRGEAAPQGQ